VAEPETALNVTDILERMLLGEQLLKKDYLAAAQAAASVRREVLDATARALAEIVPRTPEFTAFKNCMQSIGLLLVTPGILTMAEMQTIFLRLEEMERR
jgi:hypothetical protein